MRCPTCSTEVPRARFCARCGGRLGEAGAAPEPPSAARRFVRRVSDEASGSGWRLAGTIALGVVLIMVVAGVGVWVAPERGVLDGDVELPTGAAPATRVTPAAGPSPPPAPSSATVVCSDFKERRIDDARLGDASLGDTVELHGGTCVVLSIDADPGSRLYPRGVARGGRPGTRPMPGR